MRLMIALCLVLVCSSLAAQERVMTPEDITRVRQVTSAELSPDGKTIAYTLQVPRAPFEDDNGPAWSELHVWKEGEGSRPFIGGKVNISAVAWTPDGKGISFLAKRDGDEQRSLYVIPVDGGEARRVLTHETGVGGYDWSPVGNRVAFLASQPKNKDREALAEKGFNMEFYEEDLPSTKVWIADFAGDEVSKEEVETDGSVSEVAWSPDGKKLAIFKAPTPLVDDSLISRRVFVIDGQSREIIKSVNNPGKLGSIEWSPDSNKIAFTSAANINDPNPGRLYVAALDKDGVDKYFMEDEGDVNQFAWRDNETIIYLWDEGVDISVRTLEIEGGKTSSTLDMELPTFPGMSSAADGKQLALVGDSPSHPRELFLWRDGDETATRLTNSNPWMDEVRLAPQEVITYKARDGLELQGLLIRPLDEKKGQRYPLIVTVHGGPEAHYSNGWLTGYSMLGQVAAARGFAVFYPNYRASTGRGVAFSMLDHGRPAMEQFDDLVDGAKHLVNMGLVDEKKVGVTGGSYGGYATAWCSTALTEHFAAGVMFVGISNKISKFGTSDIPNELYLVHDRKRIWEDWDLFLRQSPIYHVEKARTPLLIMHGKNDTRVHPAQSMELYRHLKTLGKVPVRLVFYPGEGHGNRRAASRYDYTHRALRWMEHYLKGSGDELPPLDIDYPLGKKDEDGASSESE